MQKNRKQGVAIEPHSHAACKKRKAHVREEKEHESRITIQILSRCTLCQCGVREGREVKRAPVACKV